MYRKAHLGRDSKWKEETADKRKTGAHRWASIWSTCVKATTSHKRVRVNRSASGAAILGMHKEGKYSTSPEDGSERWR